MFFKAKKSKSARRHKRVFMSKKSSWWQGLSQWRKDSRRADSVLIFLIFIVTIFGLIMVYDSSIVDANQQFGDKFYYLKFQTAYFVLGWFLLIIVGHIDYHIYKKIIKWLFVGNIMLLVAVLIPGLGTKIYGARRWLDLGPFTFQPTETFKTILVLYLATWLEKTRSLQQFFTLIAFILGLIVLEPDLGTAIVIITTAFLVYYVSGVNIKKFALSSLIAVFVGLILIVSSPYRRQRLTTFLNPSADPTGSSYHIQQILLSLGSGGIHGVGFGQSRQKYQYLPEATSDSIFAIVGEEVGFLGSTALILVYLLILWKGFGIAQKAKDQNGRLIAIGITSWLGTQTFVNLASMVSLAPLTGIPLPFMSYGGTSLVVALTSMGILLNISRQTSR